MNPLIEINLDIFNTLKEDLGADFMLEMIETFCNDSHKQMALLSTALNQGDSATFTRAAHTIKSTSLTFGATSFGNLARELEMLGREGKLEDSREKCQQLMDACEPLLQALRNLCND